MTPLDLGHACKLFSSCTKMGASDFRHHQHVSTTNLTSATRTNSCKCSVSWPRLVLSQKTSCRSLYITLTFRKKHKLPDDVHNPHVHKHMLTDSRARGNKMESECISTIPIEFLAESAVFLLVGIAYDRGSILLYVLDAWLRSHRIAIILSERLCSQRQGRRRQEYRKCSRVRVRKYESPLLVLWCTTKSPKIHVACLALHAKK